MRSKAPAALGLAALLAALTPAWADAWQEGEAPPPPALAPEHLIPLEVPRSGLQFGVQPDSISVGSDDVVRYVVVATSRTGALNAWYEGLRCETGQVKVYARYTPGSGWSPASHAKWAPVWGNAGHRHTLAIERGGACLGRTPNGPAAQIRQDLQAPPDRQFRPELH